jgi:dTDP-4-dehydrorhamnose reductase
MIKIAVTGPKGRLGSALVSNGAIPIHSDITQPEALYREILNISPDVIINCAAKSKVNWCEENQKTALAINYRGAVNVRKCFNGWMIQLSTDWIFDGREGPYKESARPAPLNSYGWSKWGAEIMLEAFAELPCTIVRVTNLYDGTTDNFATDVVATLEAGEEFKASPDLYGNPTYIPHLVWALQDIIIRKLDYIQKINIAGTDRMSRYNFAVKIAEKMRLDTKLITPVMPSNLYGTTKYPLNGGFDLTLAKEMLIPLYTLDEGLEEFSHGITA